MKKTTKSNSSKKKSSMREEYDFSGGVRGKYAGKYAAENNLVAISSDVAKVFRDSDAVNEALRTLMRVSGKKSPKAA